MGSIPAESGTFVGQVTATIGGIDVDDVTGPLDVHLLPADGTIEISLGSGWAQLTDTAALLLIEVLLRAHGLARQVDGRREMAHARQMVESLDLPWPA